MTSGIVVIIGCSVLSLLILVACLCFPPYKSEEEWDSDEETDESEWDSDCLSDGDEDHEGKYWAGPPYFTDGYD